MTAAEMIIEAGRQVADELDRLEFSAPVDTVYNPLRYAFQPWRRYIELCATTRHKVLFLGMNPGPWGMVQTGIPFGEVSAVTDWLDIHEPIDRPARSHPKRPVAGYSCTRSEVSGRRLWGLFRERFGSATRFFEDHAVLNYCPLAFVEASGRNLTPDKLPPAERAQVTSICDRFLALRLAALGPRLAVGVGGYAEKALTRVLASDAMSDARRAVSRRGLTTISPPNVARILHPSPASPRANAGWSDSATAELVAAGVWRAD